MEPIKRFKRATAQMGQQASDAKAELKVLIIDDDGEDRRKERISVLTGLGVRVYPALNLREARSRCKPGRFSLIVVRGAQDPALAIELCDGIRQSDPDQPLLLLAGAGCSLPSRDFTIPEDSGKLAQGAKKLLGLTQGEDGFARAA